MPKTISIGGATYDLFIRTGEDLIHECSGDKSIALPLGSKIKVKDVIETCGGGANNSSVGLSRLGCSASFCGVIGSDQWGDKLIENFKKENVNTDCATIVEDEVTSFSVILSASGGERCILYTPGTNVHLHDANFNKEAISKMDWVYLNHIQEGSCVIQDDIIEMLAKEVPPRFTWNPGGCQIDEGLDAPNNKTLLSHTDLLLLNEEEAIAFTKSQSKEEALKILIDIGAKNVCITHGKEGTLASDGEKTYHCPCLKGIEVIDTTGAGDAFGTGVTWGLISGKSLSEALKAGTINAASVVSKIGAQAGLLTDIEMTQRLESDELSVDVQPF
ncbi:carbohydrate kinase family protein [Patescibacteria group bacterium]|nr:carbohydrate kinase family protein [Patescibacteria group bacterium]MBU1123166.1 carbohydrate kinase family protein [Patescibacteria group bacterium]MBU1911127.1 carbohydrate kinase family protein [Patescibacteria group bacterium]